MSKGFTCYHILDFQCDLVSKKAFHDLLKFGIFGSSFLFIFCFLSSPLIAAQLRPGTLENQFEKRVEPRSTEKNIVAPPRGQEPPQEAGTYHFVLKNIFFDGGTIYSEDDLSAYYQHYIGQEISVKTLFAIASSITNRYADDGYALSLAYVPTQEIGDEGSVRIIIVEGYIGEISYQGDLTQLSRRAKRQIDQVLTEKPLTVVTLERQLLLANDLPGTTFVTTIDKSSHEVGAAKLIVELVARDFGYSLGFSNRGSKAQGPWRTSVATHFDGLFTDSTIGVNVQLATHPREMQFYGLNYGIVVADNGLRLNLNASLSKSEPDIDILNDLEYETRSENFSTSLVLPLVRSRRQNWDSSLRLDIKQSDSHFFGQINSDEKTRVLRLGTTYDWIDQIGGTNLVQILVSQGLDIFGATDNDSPRKVRSYADYQFTAMRMDVSRNQLLTARTSFLFTATMQYASDPLAPSEQIGWGGEYAGRAYDSFELSGDHGMMASIELRQTWQSLFGYFNYVQPYIFLEGAKLWTEVNVALGGGTIHVEEYDYGIGIRGQAWDKHHLYMELDVPGDRDVAQEGNREVRFFVGWQIVY